MGHLQGVWTLSPQPGRLGPRGRGYSYWCDFWFPLTTENRPGQSLDEPSVLATRSAASWGLLVGDPEKNHRGGRRKSPVAGEFP